MVRRLVLALTPGLLTTIAVAWCAVALPVTPGATTRLSGHRARVLAQGEGPGAVTVQSFRRAGAAFWKSFVMPWDPDDAIVLEYRAALPRDLSPRAHPLEVAPDWAGPWLMPWGTAQCPWPAEGVYENRAVDARGWPFLALYCNYVWVPDPSAPSGQRPAVHGALRLGSEAVRKGMGAFQYPVGLPLRPIWPGLVLNTGVFGAGWALLLFAPGITRGTLRRRRGQCPRCGYDLRALRRDSPCPECGALISKLARTQR